MSELITEHIPETVTVEIVVTESFGMNNKKIRTGIEIDPDEFGGISAEPYRVLNGHREKIKNVVTDELGEFDAEAIDVEDEEHVVASATVDRDTLEIVDDEDEDAGEDDEPELVTDGGEEVGPGVSDEEIEQAIAQHDDPDHPDAHTVDEIREALADINADIIDHWDLYADAIDEGSAQLNTAHEIVHEDSDVIVLADHSGHFWTEQLDVTPGVDDSDDILRSIAISLHHTAARGVCDHSWSTSDPVVVSKPNAFRAGESHVLREIARRTRETGSVARAVDQLATEVHGHRKSMWADLTGRNPSTVTRMTQPKENR